jgi:hypothetical protein
LELNCSFPRTPVVRSTDMKCTANSRYKSPMKNTKAAELASAARAIGSGWNRDFRQC